MTSRHESLIRSLGSDLKPVQRLRPPALRALGWLAIVGGAVSLVGVAIARRPYLIARSRLMARSAR